jgi:hypothetical protein
MALSFLSYEKDVKGHPAYKDVVLRLYTYGMRRDSSAGKLFGGQGTINVPSLVTQTAVVSHLSCYRVVSR